MYRSGVVFAVFVFALSPTLSAQVFRAAAPPARPPRTIALQGVPDWIKEHEFKQERFTFVRIRYGAGGGQQRGSWATDFPDADVNLAAQLGVVTKLDVSVPSRVLRLTDPELAKYPFAYMAEPGKLQLSHAEITALREYVLGGGFLLIDDFWGEAEWQHLRKAMQRVLPDREPRDLPLSHVLFHCVFDLNEKPQVINISSFLAGQKTERSDAPEARYRALVDDRDRVMVLMCHNTDLADGWERAGIDARYTREMSQRKAFPMGINIVFYALTQAGKN